MESILKTEIKLVKRVKMVTDQKFRAVNTMIKPKTTNSPLLVMTPLLRKWWSSVPTPMARYSCIGPRPRRLQWESRWSVRPSWPTLQWSPALNHESTGRIYSCHLILGTWPQFRHVISDWTRWLSPQWSTKKWAAGLAILVASHEPNRSGTN